MLISKFFVTGALLLFTYAVIAQNVVVPAGGDAANDDVSISYTVGQVVYSTTVNDHHYIIEGVQQPFEIDVVTSSGADYEEVVCNIYPNPTNAHLTLEVSTLTNCSYVLVNGKGQRLLQGSIKEHPVSLNLKLYPQGTYFVNVLSENQSVKTFQIIKK